MNLQKAEQAVKNAQNQLDEAMRQLEAAKDPWEKGRPRSGSILLATRRTDGVEYAVIVLGDRAMWFGRREASASDSVDYLVSAYNWRYANRGEVNISW